jgi:hypothetical protein
MARHLTGLPDRNLGFVVGVILVAIMKSLHHCLDAAMRLNSSDYMQDYIFLSDVNEEYETEENPTHHGRRV